MKAFWTVPLFLLPAVLHAQAPDTVRPSVSAAPASGAIRIDGELDEEAWAAAPVATGFTESYPKPGEPARLRTEARVLYGDEAVYIAVRAFDSAPDSIASQLGRRDAGGIYSDWIHVILDSYNDNRSAFRFSVTPRGVKKDVYHSNDGQEDTGWDAVWYVATHVDSLGWTAEFRIPLSQLRYTGTEPPGGRVWGFQVMRDVARYDARYAWAPWKRSDPGFVSFFGDLTGLDGLASPRRLEVRPYTVARVTRAPEANPGDPFYRSNEPFAALGGDLQYGIGSNFTLTATFNPDFGQVEADPSEVNLTAFESYFSEKRPFFLEGADIFNFGIGLGDDSGESLFYSRRIGRAPQRGVFGAYRDVPEQTTILGAAKLTGRTSNGWSMGVLNAVTAEEAARYVLPTDPTIQSVIVEPLTNYGIARARRDFRNGQSSVGGVLTTVHRRLEDGLLFLPEAAYAAGLDAQHRFANGTWEASGWVVGSQVEGDTLAIQRLQRSPARYFQRPDAGHLTYDPTRSRLGGVAGSLNVGKIGGGKWRGGMLSMFRSPGFEANDVGFQQEADQLILVGHGRFLQFEPQGPFRNWNVGANVYGGTNWDLERTFTGGNVNGSFQFRSLWGGYAGVERSLGSLNTGALRGGPAIVSPARVGGWFGGYTDRRKSLSYSINANWGLEDETDGYRWSFGPAVDWRPSARLDLSARPSFSRARNAWQYVGARTDALTNEPKYLFGRLDQTTAALTLRTNYIFTPDLSLQLYAQPFVSAGDYDGFLEVEDPRAPRFADRLHRLRGEEIRECRSDNSIVYGVRPRAGGCGDEAGFAYRIGNRDFNFKAFNSNAVLRWEYRPGSALFVVWSQGRQQFLNDGSFGLRRDFNRLFGLDDEFAAEPTNVLLVKLTYWLGL